jgi:hypothetical protein
MNVHASTFHVVRNHNDGRLVASTEAECNSGRPRATSLFLAGKVVTLAVHLRREINSTRTKIFEQSQLGWCIYGGCWPDETG